MVVVLVTTLLGGAGWSPTSTADARAPDEDAQSGAAGDEDLGREVFDAHCAMCHGTDAGGMMGMHPSLRGAVERLTREGVEVAIRRGRDVQPPMPAFEDRLDDDQIEAVIAFVESLPEGPRDFGPGAEGMDGMMDPDGMMGRDGVLPWRSGTAIAVGVLAALLTGVLGGIAGYALGRRSARRST